MRIIFIFKNFKKVFFREAKGDNKKWGLHLFIFGIKIQKCQVLFFNKWGAFFEVETLSFVYYFILVFCYQDLVPSCLWGVYHSKNATSKIAPYLLFLIRACTVMLQLCEHPPPLRGFLAPSLRSSGCTASKSSKSMRTFHIVIHFPPFMLRIYLLVL